MTRRENALIAQVNHGIFSRAARRCSFLHTSVNVCDVYSLEIWLSPVAYEVILDRIGLNAVTLLIARVKYIFLL